MTQAIAAVRERFSVAAVTFSSFDPDADTEARGPSIVARLSAAFI